MKRAWCMTIVGILGCLGLANAQKPTDLKPGSKPIAVKTPERKEPVSYTNELADILADRCVGCHGEALAENKLSLENVPAMLKGGKRGPALVPGKASESLLFRMAAHQVEPVMPPQDKPGNSPMTGEELGLLKLWIDAGAKDDSDAPAGGAKPKEVKAVVLGELPPGIHPINALDMTARGERVAAGRANVVQVYDVESGLEIVSLGGHQDLIQSVRFSPDGGMLAAGSYQIITLWKVPTGGLAKTMAGHEGPVLTVATSHDGKTAYSGGQDRTIRAWNPAEGKELWKLSLPSAVTSLAPGTDGTSLLAGGADGTIRTIRLSDRKEMMLLQHNGTAVIGLTILPHGAGGARLVSLSADGAACLWTIPVSITAEPRSMLLRKLAGGGPAVSVAGQGSMLIAGTGDGTIGLWNSDSGEVTRSFKGGHSGPIAAMAVSPDGRLLATGSSDRTIRLIDLAGDRPARVLKGHGGSVQGLAFSPQGDRLVSAAADGGIKVWEVATGQGVIAFGHAPPKDGPMQPVRAIAFTGEGSLISASGDGTLKTWTYSGSWSAPRTFGPHSDRVLAIDFSPDGKLMAAGAGDPSRSGELKLWDIARGETVRVLDTLHSDTIFALRFSPDGKRLASAAADKFLKVTDVATGKELRSFEGHTHHVMSVDWKNDGKQLVTGGADKVLKLWDFETGEQVRSFPEVGKQVTSVRWIPGKSEIVAASGDAQVRVWNTEGRRRSGSRTLSGPSDYVYAVAASADGARIAAGGAEGVLYLWDGRTGKPLRKIEPPSASSTAAR
jgi:WD40 repeat protein